MYGISISGNSDGSLIVVGAPMNVPNVTVSGGAMLLTSQNSKTCEYTVRPVWRPRNSYKYYGAQVALSEDGSTMLVMDGVEAVMVKPNGTTNGSMALVPAGNKPVVHVFRKSRTPFVKPPPPPPAPPGPWDPECCANVTNQCCVDAAKKYGNWGPKSDKKNNGVMDISDMPFMGIPGTPSWELAWMNRTGGNGSSSGNSSSSASHSHGKHDKKGKDEEPAPGLPAGKPYRRLLGLLEEEFRYVQKLDCELRQAMAASMAVSVSKDGDTVLVSFAIGEGFPDKRGSAQVSSVYICSYSVSVCTRILLQSELALVNRRHSNSMVLGSATLHVGKDRGGSRFIMCKVEIPAHCLLLLLLLLLLLQVFYWDKDTQRYKFIQDLEALNQPAGAQPCNSVICLLAEENCLMVFVTTV
jgi:hypothetical protein